MKSGLFNLFFNQKRAKQGEKDIIEDATELQLDLKRLYMDLTSDSKEHSKTEGITSQIKKAINYPW